MGKVVKAEFGNYKEIVKYAEGLLSLTATVDSEAVVADEKGRKILPAGTIVSGSLTDRATKVKKTVGADAIGVTRYDVDVTHGDDVVAVVYAGTINLKNLPEAPNAASTAVLPNLIFMN